MALGGKGPTNKVKGLLNSWPPLYLEYLFLMCFNRYSVI